MVFRFACNVITLATNKWVSSFWDEKLKDGATFEDDCIFDISLIFKTRIIQCWDQESCCANALNLNISAHKLKSIFAKDPFPVDFLSMSTARKSEDCPFPVWITVEPHGKIPRFSKRCRTVRIPQQKKNSIFPSPFFWWRKTPNAAMPQNQSTP